MALSYLSIFTSVRLGKGEKYRFEVEVEPPPHWDAPSVQKIGTQTIKDWQVEQFYHIDLIAGTDLRAK